MRWIIQENLNSVRNYIDVIHVLEKLNIEFMIVSIKDEEITVLDKETKLPLAYSEILIHNFTDGFPVMVYGSKALASIAQNLNLKPGSFLNDNFEFDELKNKFGNHLLNSEFIKDTLFNLNPPWNEFFVRPTGNTKMFTGFSTTLESFHTWKKDILSDSNKYTGEQIMVSPIKKILSEYRFFVVKGEVVASSSYIVNGLFDTSGEVTASILSYVKQMIDIFNIAEAYVIDICVNLNGCFNIVEFNNINTSGVYNCNIESIVQALENSF